MNNTFNMGMAIPEIAPQYKVCLTVDETAGVFGIGKCTLRKLIEKNPNADYLLHIGSKTLFKRTKFEEFINARCELT